MRDIEHKIMSIAVWEEPKCHIGIGARSVDGWLADSEISCCRLVVAACVEALGSQGGCVGDVETPAAQLKRVRKN